MGISLKMTTKRLGEIERGESTIEYRDAHPLLMEAARRAPAYAILKDGKRELKKRIERIRRFPTPLFLGWPRSSYVLAFQLVP